MEVIKQWPEYYHIVRACVDLAHPLLGTTRKDVGAHIDLEASFSQWKGGMQANDMLF